MGRVQEGEAEREEAGAAAADDHFGNTADDRRTCPGGPAGGVVSSGSLAEGAPPPLPYELENDGTLVVSGDVLIDCPYEFRVAEQYAGTQPSDPEVSADLEQNANLVRLCEENGFSPSSETAPVDNPDEAVAGNGTSNIVPTRDTPAPGPDGTSEGLVPVGVPVNEDATLPDTSGIGPLTLLGSTGALLLLGETRVYRRKDGQESERGPYWYFRFHEGGKQKKLYLGRTDDPEGALAAKRAEAEDELMREEG